MSSREKVLRRPPLFCLLAMHELCYGCVLSHILQLIVFSRIKLFLEFNDFLSSPLQTALLARSRRKYISDENGIEFSYAQYKLRTMLFVFKKSNISTRLAIVIVRVVTEFTVRHGLS